MRSAQFNILPGSQVLSAISSGSGSNIIHLNIEGFFITQVIFDYCLYVFFIEIGTKHQNVKKRNYNSISEFLFRKALCHRDNVIIESTYKRHNYHDKLSNFVEINSVRSIFNEHHSNKNATLYFS